MPKRNRRLPQIMTEKVITSGARLQLRFDYFAFDLLENFCSFVRIQANRVELARCSKFEFDNILQPFHSAFAGSFGYLDEFLCVGYF